MIFYLVNRIGQFLMQAYKHYNTINSYMCYNKKQNVIGLPKFSGYCFLCFLLFAGLEMVSQFSAQNRFKVFEPQTEQPAAVCLLIHGLNLKPSKMQWICDRLLENGAVVVRLELTGHGGFCKDDSQADCKMDDFRQVSWRQWMMDVEPALSYLDSVSAKHALPKYLVGFSLGGLVGMNIENTYHQQFEKYVLFAPALKIRALPKFALSMASVCPKAVIRSRSPEAYRDNRGTPLAAYKAVIDGMKQLKNADFPQFNSCSILIDIHDELVSPRKTKKIAKAQNISLHIINKQKENCDYCSCKHLIVDDESLGEYSKTATRLIDSLFL